MFFIVSNLGLGSLSKYHGDCQNHEVLDNIDDNDGDDDDIRRCVSKANILVSEASKPSAGARIFRGP